MSAERQSDRQVLRELQRRLAGSETVVLVTAVATEESPPCRAGQKLLLGAAGAVAGTLGCAELDTAAAIEASKHLGGCEPGLVWLEQESGRVNAYFERFEPAPRLVILGRTPVADSLARWAPDLGWDVVVVERHPNSPSSGGDSAGSGHVTRLREMALSASDAVVATDHDAPGLVSDLEAALRSGAGFVGVMGSRRHAGPHLGQLRDRGVDPEELRRIESPVGLDLGGRSAPEIALSILAGLVARRHRRDGGPLRGHLPHP